MLACPDRNVLADYALGKLNEPLASSLDEHVGSCADCQDQLGALGAPSDPLLETLRRPPPDDGYAHEPECRQGLLLAAQALAHGRRGAAEQALRAPDVLRDYHLLGALGRGGMGSVYRAVHTRLNKEVALKIIAPERQHSLAAARRFEQEMKAVGRLDHPHVVRATDAGEEAGLAYLAMELVCGIDLNALVRRRGPLPIAAACELTRQAAEGLAYIHDHGLVHRDIKPANLMLTSQGTVKILDLGLALLNDPLGGPGTGTSHVLGTADYLAPEQIDACHDVSGAADIYSLGCALYELLTGEPPFSGEAYAATTKKLLAHSQAPAPSLGEKRPDVPVELVELLEQMLAKQPADRPQSAAEVARKLARFAVDADLSALISADGPSGSAPPLQSDVVTGSFSRAASTPSAAAVKQHNAAVAETGRKPTPRRTRIALAMAGVVLLGAVVIIIRKGDSVRAWIRVDPDDSFTVEQRDEPIEAEELAPRAPRGSGTRSAPSADDARVTPSSPEKRKDARPAIALRGLVPHPVPIKGIRAWQLSTVNPRGWVTSLCFSADGRRLAVGCDDLRVYEVDRLRLVWAVDCGHDRSILSLRMGPSSDYAGTGSRDGCFKLVDLRDGSVMSIRPDHGRRDTTGGWSHDLAFAASTGSDGLVKLWNRDGGFVRTVGHHDGTAGDFLCWDRDGRKLATCGGNIVCVWNVDGSPGAVLTGHEGRVWAADFSADGSQIATANADGTVRLWDRDGKLRHVLRGHDGGVNSVAWNPEGDVLASGGTDMRVRFWKADGSPGSVVSIDGWVSALAWSPDGQRLAVGSAGALNVLARDGSLLLNRHTAGSGPHSTAFSPSGDRLAAFCSDSAIRVWTSDGRKETTVGGGTEMADISWSPDGNRFATADLYSRTATIWPGDGGPPIRRLPHGAIVHKVVWSNDGRRLATAGDDGHVCIWSEDGAKQFSFKAQEGGIAGFDWNRANSRFVTGGSDGMRVWGEDGTLLTTLTAFGRSIAFSPDGQWLAATDPVEIRSLDGKLLHRFPNPKWGCHDVCWSGDSTRLAVTGVVDLNARIWRANGLPGGPDLFLGAGGGGSVIRWNPARPQIATSLGLAVILWNADTGEPQWVALGVAGHTFRFTASGEPLGAFDEPAADRELVYQIVPDDGDLELLSPSQFKARVAEANRL